jgi:hypothetical protein
MEQKLRVRDRLMPTLLIAAAYTVWLAVGLVSGWLIFQEVRSFFLARD